MEEQIKIVIVNISKNNTIIIPKRLRSLFNIKHNEYIDFGCDSINYNFYIIFKIEQANGIKEMYFDGNKVNNRFEVKIPIRFVRFYNFKPGMILQLRINIEKKYAKVYFIESDALSLKKMYNTVGNLENKYLWGSDQRFIDL